MLESALLLYRRRSMFIVFIGSHKIPRSIVLTRHIIAIDQNAFRSVGPTAKYSQYAALSVVDSENTPHIQTSNNNVSLRYFGWGGLLCGKQYTLRAGSLVATRVDETHPPVRDRIY